MINAYGPTESTVCASVSLIQADDTAISIGDPISGMQLYVLDENLNTVPLNMNGELYIAGYGIARGYLNKPGLTSEYFLPDPFSTIPGQRMYKTGDLVKIDSNRILFIGRKDYQYKINGIRVRLL